MQSIVACEHLVARNVGVLAEILLRVDADEVGKLDHLAQGVDVDRDALLHDAGGCLHFLFAVRVDAGCALCLRRLAQLAQEWTDAP